MASSRVHARVAALAVVAIIVPTTRLRAQLTPGVQLSAGAAASDLGPDWQAASDVVAWLHFDRPWMRATLEGAAASEGRERWAYGGLATAALFAPPWHGLRPSVSLATARQQASVDQAVLETQGIARLAYRHAASGLWLGGGWGAARITGAVRGASEGAAAGAAAGAASPVLPAGWSSEVGGWHQFGSAIVRIALTSHARSLDSHPGSPRAVAIGPLHYDPRSGMYVVDTTSGAPDRWSEAEAGLYWARGPWSFDAGIGRPVSGVRTGGAWARLDGAVLLSDRLAVVIGAGLSPAKLALLAPDRRRLTLGLRWTRAPLRHTEAPAVEPTAAAFRVERADSRRARIYARVPGARTVELGADFTAWRPVALQRTAPEEWSVTLPIAPGTYRVNLRVDGGTWRAPPGVPRVRDDFAGDVGLVVVR